MITPPRLHPQTPAVDRAILLVFTLASALAINPYFFGWGDNSITIPFLKAWIDPALYPGDYLIAQRPYYYTYLWNALGLVHAHLHVGLPALFFTVYLAALYLTFFGVYRLAISLFDSREVAMIALLFLLFSRTTLGGVETLEETLNTRQVAAPILLFAIDAWLHRATMRSFVLLGVAYLIHPLTTHYVLAMLVVVALVEHRRGGLRRLVTSLPVFLLLASPVLAWRFRHRPPSLHLLSADPQWLVALHYRSSHHMFPSTWGWPTLVYVIVLLTLFAIAWRHRNRERDGRHRVIAIGFWTILAWCAFGVVGSEIHPIGLAFVAQPMRSFQFLEYFVILYVAYDFHRRASTTGRLWGPLSAVVMAGALMTTWSEYGPERHLIPLAIFSVIATFLIARRDVARMIGFSFVGLGVGLVVVAAIGSHVSDRWHEDLALSIGGNQKSAFLDVQRWAQAHTGVQDGFIVPPYEDEEFRVEGERTVYADAEDGGLMNSNPAFGREWLRRMKALGVANPRPAGNGMRAGKIEFCALEVDRFKRIALEMEPVNRRVFLVWPCPDRKLALPVRYSNQSYVVYEVN